MMHPFTILNITLMLISVVLSAVLGWLWFATLPWWLALPGTAASSIVLGVSSSKLALRRRRGGDDR